MKFLLSLILITIFLDSNAQIKVRDQEFLLDKTQHVDLINLIEPQYQDNPSLSFALDLADAFTKLKKFEKAIMYYEIALNSSQLNESQNLNYFNSLYEFGDYEAARKIATDYKTQYGKPELLEKMMHADTLRNQDPTYFETNLSSNSEDDDFGLISLTGTKKIVNSNFEINRHELEYMDKKRTPHPYIIDYEYEINGYKDLSKLLEKQKGHYDIITHFDKAESKVYITRSNLGAKNIMSSKIIIATLFEDYTLGNFTDFTYNSPDYSCGQVSVSNDGEMLYFVSDKSGGMGGADIYRCLKLEDGSWGFPINLGKNVNSIGDELYPYISPQGNMLYFSSSYHSLFGGLDINKSEKTRAHLFKKPENMGLPFNSNKDDFGVYFNDNYGTEGYFNSNREEDAKGGDDVYFFSYQNNKVCKDPVKNFKITVVDKKTKKRISNVHLTMTVKNDGRKFEGSTDHTGELLLTVEGCTDFDVEATNDFYLNNLFYYDGFRKTVTVELDKKELNNIIGIDRIFYEVGKFEVPNASIAQLTKLAGMLSRNRDVKIELSSHTDSRGDDKSNQDLSQKRAENIVNYLVKSGVNRSQMVAQGYGESKLMNDCGNTAPCGEDKHEVNRRTEFKIIEIGNQ